MPRQGRAWRAQAGATDRSWARAVESPTSRFEPPAPSHLPAPQHAECTDEHATGSTMFNPLDFVHYPDDMHLMDDISTSSEAPASWVDVATSFVDDVSSTSSSAAAPPRWSEPEGLTWASVDQASCERTRGTAMFKPLDFVHHLRNLNDADGSSTSSESSVYSSWMDAATSGLDDVSSSTSSSTAAALPLSEPEGLTLAVDQASCSGTALLGTDAFASPYSETSVGPWSQIHESGEDAESPVDCKVPMDDVAHLTSSTGNIPAAAADGLMRTQPVALQAHKLRSSSTTTLAQPAKGSMAIKVEQAVAQLLEPTHSKNRQRMWASAEVLLNDDTHEFAARPSTLLQENGIFRENGLVRRFTFKSATYDRYRSSGGIKGSSEWPTGSGAQPRIRCRYGRVVRADQALQPLRYLMYTFIQTGTASAEDQSFRESRRLFVVTPLSEAHATSAQSRGEPKETFQDSAALLATLQMQASSGLADLDADVVYRLLALLRDRPREASMIDQYCRPDVILQGLHNQVFVEVDATRRRAQVVRHSKASSDSVIPFDKWLNTGGKRGLVKLEMDSGEILERRAGRIQQFSDHDTSPSSRQSGTSFRYHQFSIANQSVGKTNAKTSINLYYVFPCRPRNRDPEEAIPVKREPEEAQYGLWKRHKTITGAAALASMCLMCIAYVIAHLPCDRCHVPPPALEPESKADDDRRCCVQASNVYVAANSDCLRGEYILGGDAAKPTWTLRHSASADPHVLPWISWREDLFGGSWQAVVGSSYIACDWALQNAQDYGKDAHQNIVCTEGNLAPPEGAPSSCTRWQGNFGETADILPADFSVHQCKMCSSASACLTENEGDNLYPGFCNKLWTCDQMGYNGGLYAGKCDLTCGINWFDIKHGTDTCRSVLATGWTCEQDFCFNCSYSGACDFACNFCHPPSKLA